LATSPETEFAERLRALRRKQRLTQAQLARALGDISVSAISAWESPSDLKWPTTDRLRLYALFFARDHPIGADPQLSREQDLNASEREKFEALHRELVALREAAPAAVAAPDRKSFWTFDGGPITIVCPEVPADRRSPLAKERNPNYTKTYRYADLDALIEVYAEIRACNPGTPVRHALASEVLPHEMKGHLVIIGGIGWHQAAPWLQQELNGLPIQQVVVRDLENGEIFRTTEPFNREFRPRWEDGKFPEKDPVDPAQLKAEQTEDAWRGNTRRELVADVAMIARILNPIGKGRTITICNGVYSHGVVGAALSLIDSSVRKDNEAYINARFPGGSFIVLTRIMLGNREAVPAEFGDPKYRLYEWPPHEEAAD